MKLLPKSEFTNIFEPYSGRKVGVVDGWGNAGDRLLYAATRQLLRDFGMKWVTFNPLADQAEDFDIDVLFLFAGGSMGAVNARPALVIREAALATGLPCVVLPQSFHAREDLPYERVYVREETSLHFRQDGVLAPDLALGYNYPEVPSPTRCSGVFLRCRGESLFPARAKIDPAGFCYTPEEYIQFVSDFEHIITDRLHLAIIAMGLGRKATLLPVAYHKNRSMWETWLESLGCKWAATPEDA